MSLASEFVKQPFFHKLEKRAYTFLKMMEHLDQTQERFSIIETGCAHIDDCWGGHGMSTLIWSWAKEQCPHIEVHSLELIEDHIEKSRLLTKDINYHQGDSLRSLTVTPVSDCWLLYLDSFDWSKLTHMDSSFHHVCELLLVWKELPSGCMIVVDDRHSRDMGKHFMVQAFMEKLNIKPVFVDYQIGWIKP